MYWLYQNSSVVVLIKRKNGFLCTSSSAFSWMVSIANSFGLHICYPSTASEIINAFLLELAAKVFVKCGKNGPNYFTAPIKTEG